MAMRGSSVRGTPYHHISNTAHEGIKAGTPKGMKGTVPDGYAEPGIHTGPQGPGTPYHSQAGNGPETRRVVAHGTNVESSDHGNQNSPESNGKGVIFDGANDYNAGFMPHAEAPIDSPVPRHAPGFDTRSIREEDRAHVGTRNEGALESLIDGKGVMSRGMDTVSRSSEPETELIKDDVFRGTGGSAGSPRDIQGHGIKRSRE